MRILIFGASGMIGHRVWLATREAFGKENIFGVFRKPKEHFASYGIFDQNIIDGVDVSDWEKVESILAEVKPDVIINALGITIRKEEIKDLARAMEINSFFPHRLLKWAQRNNSRVIHYSTDCVFSGELGQYTEASNPSAKDTYGKTKFLGEIADVRGLTLRFSCIGRELDSHTELLDWFLSQKGVIKGYSNAIYSGVTTHVVADQTVRVIKNFPELNGVFQFSGTPISKYDLLCLIKDSFRSDTVIHPFSDYVSDKTLNNQKFSARTGYVAPSWAEMIETIRGDKSVIYKDLKR